MSVLSTGVRYRLSGTGPRYRIEKWEGSRHVATHLTTRDFCDCPGFEYRQHCQHLAMVRDELEGAPVNLMVARRVAVDVLHRLRLDRSMRRVRLAANPFRFKGQQVVAVTLLAEGMQTGRLYETVKNVLVCVRIGG